MNVKTFCAAFLSTLTISISMVGCQTDTVSPVINNEAVKTNTGFLATSYEPLDKWFSERFEVEYRAMTPDLIFDQVPINSIRYNKSNLPKGAPLFNLESKNISRREILKKIAKFWDLEMSIENGSDGKPSSVKVVGKG